VAVAELLAPDVDAPDGLAGELPQPLSKATEQTTAIPSDDRRRTWRPDPRRLMPPTGTDPDETTMRKPT
jgi:hypothetical protein